MKFEAVTFQTPDSPVLKLEGGAVDRYLWAQLELLQHSPDLIVSSRSPSPWVCLQKLFGPAWHCCVSSSWDWQPEMSSKSPQPAQVMVAPASRKVGMVVRWMESDRWLAL